MFNAKGFIRWCWIFAGLGFLALCVLFYLFGLLFIIFLKTWYKQVFFYTNVYYIGSITFVSLN